MKRSSFVKKSLAVAATGSLAVVGLSAPAAYAADSITLAPLNGTGSGAIVGTTFLLKTSVAGADGNKISWTIEGADATEVLADIVREDSVAGLQASEVAITNIPLTADADDAWGATDADADDVVNYVNANDVLAVSAAPAEDDAAATFTATAADDHEAIEAEPYYILSLELDADVLDEGEDLVVTAFEDGNQNGIYDADLNEKKSESVTVSFIEAGDVTGTVTQTPVAGAADAAEVDVNVTFTNVNMGSITEAGDDAGAIDQLARVQILINGAEDGDAELADDPDVNASDFDDTDDRFEVTMEPTGEIANGDVVVARVYVGELAGTTANRLAQARTGLNDEINAFAGAVDGGGNKANHIEVADTQSYVIDDNDGGTADIRPGDGSFTVFVDALDADGDAVGAGEEVVFTVSEDSDTFDSAVKLTSGGNTLTNSDTTDDAESFDVTVETDADGRASLTVSYENLDDADTFTIDANVTGSTATADLDFTGDDADDITLIAENVDTNGSQVAEVGDRISVNLSLRDEYGLAPDNDHRVAYAISSTEMNANITGTASFSGGNGDTTISWTDTSDDIADISFDITGANLEAKDADGDFGAPTDDPADLSHTIVLTAAQTVDSVKIDDAASHDTAAAVFGQTPVAVDLNETNSNFDSAWAGVFDNEGDQVIDIDVLDEDNVGLEGIAVTVSGAGYYFADEGQTVFRPNSITVYTDANGNAIVDWDSNVVGESTITVTAGGKSDTVDLTVTRSTDDADVDSWSMASAPSTVEPQSTLNLAATILDEWGNGVDGSGHTVSVTYEGPGIQIPAASTIDVTSATGVVSLSLFFGANDSGTHTVTFTHAGDDDNLTTTDDNVNMQYSFTIGSTYGSMTAWTKDMGDGTAKVYVKFPTIGEKVRIGHQKNGSGSYETIYVKTLDSETHPDLTVNVEGSYIVRTIDLVDGTNRIRVTVGDDREVQVRYNE